MTTEENPEFETDLAALMDEVLDTLATGVHPAVPDAIPTGLASLDRLLGGGLRPGTVNQLAGRGSVGKTCLALQAVRATAIDHGLPTMHVSFEERLDGITCRFLAARCNVRKDHFHHGHMTDEDRAAITPERRQEIGGAPWRVAEGVKTIADIERAAREVEGLRLLVIDSAIALVMGLSEESGREYDELGLRLRALARETGAAILVVTHIPSVGPERTHEIPTNTDRRAATYLDPVCDTILLLHTAADNPREPWVDDTFSRIHVVKRRNGSTGVAEAVFERAYGRYRDLTEAEEADPWRH